MSTRLTDDELRAVLARAEAIQGSARLTNVSKAELAAFIEAAEEVGYPRSAVELALRERLGVPAAPPAVGDRVFAKSADGKFYVAEVLASAEDAVRVRFLRGGEHTVTPLEVRPCSFLPGERVVCPWPHWGPWTCTVLSYDAPAQRIKVSDGWAETREFLITEVWLNPPRVRETQRHTRMIVGLLAAGAAIGAVVGSIVTALLTG